MVTKTVNISDIIYAKNLRYLLLLLFLIILMDHVCLKVNDTKMSFRQHTASFEGRDGRGHEFSDLKISKLLIRKYHFEEKRKAGLWSCQLPDLEIMISPIFVTYVIHLEFRKKITVIQIKNLIVFHGLYDLKFLWFCQSLFEGGNAFVYFLRSSTVMMGVQ